MRKKESVRLVSGCRLPCLVLLAFCINGKTIGEDADGSLITGVRRKVNVVLGIEPLAESSLHVGLDGSTPHARIMRAVFPPIYRYLPIIILSPSGRRTTLKHPGNNWQACLTQCFITVDSGGNDVAIFAFECDTRTFPSNQEGRNALRKFAQSSGKSQPSRFESFRIVSSRVESGYRLESFAEIPMPADSYRAVSLWTTQPEKGSDDPWLYVLLHSQKPPIDRFRNEPVRLKISRYVSQEFHLSDVLIEICYATGNDVVIELQ